MRISLPALVRPGETATVQASLAPGPAGPVKRVFVVHFASDSAFVEPSMRLVLRQAVEYAKKHPKENLVILGHTDKAGDDVYNQSLSERRARAVFAFLTFGTDRDAALAEWNTLRLERPKGELPSVKDSWRIREEQHMLQDLGFYPGPVNGKESPLFRSAVKAFRCKAGLPPGEQLDKPAREALIRLYLEQDRFGVPKDAFLPNCPDEILKWLGGGEQDPVKNVPFASRPNRRVELLFVDVEELPCKVPQPDTFELPKPGAVGSGWCLGSGEKSRRICFFLPVLPTSGQKPEEGQWVRPLPEPGITVEVLIQTEIPPKNEKVEIGSNGKPVPQPAAGRKFLLMTPDGEVKAGESESGKLAPALTDTNGRFAVSGKPPGVYTLTVEGEVLARLAEAHDRDIKGNTVQKLLGPGDRLNVLLVDAPVLVEIRLPVAVHLLTALDPETHRPRPSGLPANETLPEAATLTAAEVRELFDGGSGQPLTVNFVWRQARIRFEIRDVIRETFETPGRSAGSVDVEEIVRFLNETCPPNVVSLFFTLSLQTIGSGDGGGTISPESATVQNFKAGASFLAQRIRGDVVGVPISPALSRLKLIEVVAHELGHFVLGHLTNAEHPNENDPANAGRLMLRTGGVLPTGDAGTPTGELRTKPNVRLVPEEVNQSRSRRAASFACVPLTLEVQGAVRVGGELSHRFFFVRSEAPSPDVEVTARISDELAAVGTVKVECATAKVDGRRCLVSTATPAVHEIEATYTPFTGQGRVTTRVVVWVVAFRLLVLEEFEDPDLRRIDPFTVVSRRSTDPSAVLTLFVELNPRPFAVPEDLITWSDTATATPDPFRRTVSRSSVGRTVVTVTIAGVSQSVAIEIFDLFFIDEAGAPITEVQIEGVANSFRSAFARKFLIPPQENFLFRLRADLPGVAAAGRGVVKAALISNPGVGPSETVPVELVRVGNSHTFLSKSFLAIPTTIPLQDSEIKDGTEKVTPKLAVSDLGVIRARAGGRLRLDVNAAVPLAGLGVTVAKVRGRVVHIFAQILEGSGIEPDDVRKQVELANLIWSQAGIEIRLRQPATIIPASEGLLSVAEGSFAQQPGGEFVKVLHPEEETLLGLGRKGSRPQDVHVYYVETLEGNRVGESFSKESHPAIENEGVAIENAKPNALESFLGLGLTEFQFYRILAHELGHVFLLGWVQRKPPRDEHEEAHRKGWPPSMLMHSEVGTVEGAGEGTDIDPRQIQNILINQKHPFILFES